MTMNNHINNYLKYLKVTKSNGTYHFNLSKSRTLSEYFGHMKPSEINRHIILDFIIYLRDRNSEITNTTINKYIGLLKRILKSECNIVIEFDSLPENKTMIEIVPDEVITKVFNYLDNDMYPEHLRNLLMFKLLLDTGLRISELLSLHINNFSFNTRTILVKYTKTKTERYVFYSEETQIYLHKYLVKEHIDSYLFINLYTRKQLTVDRVQKICQNLQKKIKTRYSISPHKWRHTFATKFISRNGNIEVLRILMGHTNILTTQRYLHVNSEKLRIEYERVLHAQP